MGSLIATRRLTSINQGTSFFGSLGIRDRNGHVATLSLPFSVGNRGHKAPISTTLLSSMLKEDLIAEEAKREELLDIGSR
jgi:hypothetical protein